jgi:DNA-binding NtrC family response regulator
MSAPGRVIDTGHLSPEITARRLPELGNAGTGRRSSAARRTLAAVVEEVERDAIRNALNEAAGNISEAARLLGLTRRGLYLKLRRLGLDTRNEPEVDVAS